MATYIKTFQTKSEAFNFMKMKNRSFEKANNTKDVLVLVDGPNNNFAIVDLFSAIELGNGYIKA